MQALTAEHRELIDYQLRLPGFEGPFDVLLRLVDRQQLPITEISLVTVTDQFLDHVQSIGGAPPYVMAEFTAVGTRLVQLKSRALLPRVHAEDEEEPSRELIVQLMEYKAVKEAAQQLGQRDASDMKGFLRGDNAVALPAAPAETRLAAHQAGSLAKALRRRLSIVPSPAMSVKEIRVVSLQELATRIVGRLRRGSTSFNALVEDCDSQQEVRSAFLALLVLMRRRVITANQEVPFGPIDVALQPAAIGERSLQQAMHEFGE